MINKGLINEIEIANELNDKKIFQLNHLYQEMINKLYPNITNDDIIKSYVSYEKNKFDIVVIIKGKLKYLSIKMGRKNSFHAESLDTFIAFLEKSKIKNEIIYNYIDYHYARKVLENKKIINISAEEYKKEYQYKIDIINKELIKSKEFIDKFLERVIFKGTKDTNQSIDGLIVGTKEYFLFFTKEEVNELIYFHLNKSSTGVHISSLFISPMSRCLNNNDKYTDYRNKIQIKWYDIFDDYILMQMKNSIKNLKNY